MRDETARGAGPAWLRGVRFPGPPIVVVVILVALIQLVGTAAASAHSWNPGHGYGPAQDWQARGWWGEGNTPGAFASAIPLPLVLIFPVASALLLALRDRRPGPMVAAVTGVTLLYFALGLPWGTVLLAPALGFLFASAARAWWWVLGSALAVEMALVAWALLEPDRGSAIRIFAITAWTAVMVLLGQAIRARIERRGERLRAAEEAEERRRDEERLALARELHDVVGHSLSTINVRASVALHLADSDPEQVKAALAAIKSASKDALIEVRQALGILRDDVPTAPTPTLARLPELIARIRETGLAVTYETDLRRPLSQEAEAAVFRIVQEALTNTIRHARATSASIRLHEDGRLLRLVVSNDGEAPGAALPGNGLSGMRERVEGLGGTIAWGAGEGDKGFRIEAELPAGRAAGDGERTDDGAGPVAPPAQAPSQDTRGETR